MVSTETVDGAVSCRSQRVAGGRGEELRGCLRWTWKQILTAPHGVWVTDTDGEGVVRRPGKTSQKGGDPRAVSSRMTGRRHV